MIVISGALVLVALVLLVIGVVDPSLPFVYASIAVSLVSLVFLVIGILQRRGEPLPSGEAAAGSSDGAPAAPRVSVEKEPARVVPAHAVRVEAPAAAPAAAGGTVLVVSGRPRYHVDGCRYLTGKDAEEIDVLEAREEGFTPCGVCKPDEALVPVDEPTAALELAPEPEVEPEPDVEPEPVPARAAGRKATSTRAAKATTAAAAPAKAARAATRTVPDPLEEVAAGRGAAPSRSSAGKAAKAPARTAKAPAAKAPAKTAKAPAAKAPAAKAPAKVPAAKAPAKAAAAPAAAAKKAGGVVVIPERGRFHRSDCRYVRGVEGAEVLTKAQATKQGFEACGVCKP